MQKLETTRFGEIEVDVDQVFTFNQGLPGFQKHKKFVLLHPDEDIPFSFLQSVEDDELSFIITNPFMFFADYQFELSKKDLSELGIEQEEEVVIFTIVTVNAQEEFSANLLAPIILNKKNRSAKQVILHDTLYRTKHILLVNSSEISQPSETEGEA
jgi:flagellar assembly factor FliW